MENCSSISKCTIKRGIILNYLLGQVVQHLISQDLRTLLDFKPTTVPLDRTTPLTILLRI